MSEELPKLRQDGLCADCGKYPAVTNDGLFCLACLRKRIKDENPIPYTKFRTSEQKQAPEFDPSPWGENNVRHLEDSS